MNRLIVVILFLLSSQLGHTQEQISLVTPYDGDTIETKNPLLAWFYLDGTSSSTNRSYYRLVLVELQDEQSAAAGVLINQPLLYIDDVQGTQLFYPYDATILEDGHRYGWQVYKITDNIVVDQSEPWEFILPIPKEPVYMKYVTLKRKGAAGSYEAVDGKIYFKMIEDYFSKELHYTIYDSKRRLIHKDIAYDEYSSIEDGEINIKNNGSNFYELDLGSFAQSGNYILEILDAKKRKYYVNFFVK